MAADTPEEDVMASSNLRSPTTVACACAAALIAGTWSAARAQRGAAASQGQPASQSQGQRVSGGSVGSPAGGGGRGAVASAVFTAADSNHDGFVTRDELKTTLDKWFSEWDSNKTGRLTRDQLIAGLNTALPQPATGGGRGAAQNQTPKDSDVQAMMAALPDKAPARPKQPRKVLVLAKASGFVHSSIPLAARTVEEMGRKTGAWNATVSYDSAVIASDNLKQYDAIFLDNTTGAYLDDPNDQATTAARRKALLDFVRGGKGLVAMHAAMDSYHGAAGAAPGRGGAAPGGGRGGAGTTLAPLFMQGDTNNDQKLSRAEVSALADTWFDKLDTEKTGRVGQDPFTQRFMGLLAQSQGPGDARRGGQAGAPPNPGTWPEYNKMIGAWFKFHWNDPQHITVKIDDPRSPLTAPFKGQSFEIDDETYTFARESWSRENVHVLTSIDYSKMSDADKAKEPAATARTDGDYGLSWIRREGKGRVFCEVHGHSERVYAIRAMLEHVLAGVQYALGDLQADDSPSVKPGTKGTR
jgi:type 1 glutamine amidotransferase